MKTELSNNQMLKIVSAVAAAIRKPGIDPVKLNRYANTAIREVLFLYDIETTLACAEVNNYHQWVVKLENGTIINAAPIVRTKNGIETRSPYVGPPHVGYRLI